MRFLRIVREVFLNHANDLDRALTIGHARQPVSSRDTEQLIMHQEAIGKACHPAQTGRITRNTRRVSVRFAADASFPAYARADFREVAARSADIRLLWRAPRGSAGRKTNKETTKQRSNQQ